MKSVRLPQNFYPVKEKTERRVLLCEGLSDVGKAENEKNDELNLSVRP